MQLPSQALNRPFVLAEVPVRDQTAEANIGYQISTYAVRVGDLGLLLPENDISELLEDKNICRLPNTPDWFNGVTNIRGNMVPVFDLHHFFEFENNPRDRRLVLIGAGDKAVCIWADDMPVMVSLSDAEIDQSQKIPELIEEFARKTFSKNGQCWVDWNIQKFFTTLGQLL